MRKRNFKILFKGPSFFIFFFLTAVCNAQEPVFNASVSSTRIFQNSVFEVQFELQNANGDDFRPPDFRNFRIAGGPAMGSSTVIVNGKVSRSQSWTYSLIAPTAGRFTLGPASVIAGRRKLNSKPVTVEVIAAEDIADSGDQAGNEAIKLIANVKPGDYYPGQQIVLEYKLFFKENIQSVTTIAEDDYADFFIQNFNSFSKQITYETINGVTFASRAIKALALFAHQSGNYTIDPMVIMAGINVPSPGNQGFFKMHRLHNLQIASAPLTIYIKPLPADPSSTDFSGAVGEYTLSTIASGQTNISTDEDFKLRIEIKGNGDARRWDPPGVITDGNFEIYDPKIIEDKMMDAEGSVFHSRTIEYTMIPLQPGDFNIHIPFRYFNPVTKNYETINSDTVYLHVSQGNNIPRHAVLDSSTMMSPRPIMEVRNIKSDDRFWLSIPHLVLFGILLSGTILGLLVTYKKRREAAIPEAEKIRSESSRRARHELDHMNKSGNIPDQEFYEKVTEVYYKFLSEKFSILPADLDSDKIMSRLVKAGIPNDLIEKAINFFNLCLSVRYGGRPGGYSREEMIHECKEVIDVLDSPVKAHI